MNERRNRSGYFSQRQYRAIQQYMSTDVNEIVFDLETQHAFSEVARGEPGLLKVSVIGVYEYATDQYRAIREDQIAEFWPILEHADRVIGFNHLQFDFPVLKPYYPGTWQDFPSLDIFQQAERTLGFRVGLDAIAQETLGAGKTAHGLDAIRWYREGNWKALEDYCLADVRVTKAVYEFGKANGYLKYRNRRGSGEFKVDFSYTKPERSVNLTLGI